MSARDPMHATRRRMIRCVAAALFSIGALAGNVFAEDSQSVPATASGGNADHGKKLYQSCTACHSIDEDDIGPRHRGLVGRRAGSVSTYVYSSALKNSGIVWDEPHLDKWLANPSELVPGTKMFFKLDDPQARADVIAYLKELQ